jgi:anaerobic magnesium-protoporphyrin IX monomethyl ester cyclase
MDILFINPFEAFLRDFAITPPLGLMGLAAYCRKQGFSVAILDLNLEPETFDVGAFLRAQAPSIVGIGGTTHSRHESFRLAALVKSVRPQTPVVYGGCHATFTAEDTLAGVPGIDIVVRGEGELTMAELAATLLGRGGAALPQVKGISFRGEGSVVHTPARERLRDLDSIPHGRDLLDLSRYGTILDYSLRLPAVAIMTSRGCPFNCFFCSASAMFGSVYTMRSPGHVADEIEYCLQRYGVKAVRFFDSTLTLQRAHILSLLDELGRRNLEFQWSCEIRVDTVDKALLTRMRQAGCYMVDFGVESASERIRQHMGKRISLDQARSVLRWCKELGIKSVVFFSFGHPDEEWRDARETLRFIDRNYHLINGVASPIFGIRIYPGTPLEGYARSRGLLPKDFSWAAPYRDLRAGPIETHHVPILLQPRFGLEELQRCYYGFEAIKARKMFSLPKLKERLRVTRSPQDLLHKGWTGIRLLGGALGGEAFLSRVKRIFRGGAG